MDEVFPAGWTLADRGPGPDENVPVWAIMADGSISMMASVVVGDDADGDYSAWGMVYTTPWWDEDKGAWKCEPDIDDNYDVRAWLPLPVPPTLAELAAPKANAPADPALLELAKLGAWLCAHHWLDIDGGADGFGPAKSGLIMNAAMRYGVMHPDNSPRSGITWTVESLLAPDGAASEGVTG